MKVKITSFEKVLASTNAEPISEVNLITSSAKIKARASNTGPVTIGDGTTDGQKWPLAAGQELDLNDIFSKTMGTDEVDLKEVFVKGAATDSVLIIYGRRP